MNKDYQIVSICTHFPREPYYCLKEWYESVKDAEPIILDGNYVNYTGLGSKPKGLYKAIKEGLVNSKVTIFTDCFDLVFQSSVALAYELFISRKDTDIIVSAERNCFPSELKDEYDLLNIPTSFKYLNSGFIIGYTGAILEALESMELNNVPDDYRGEDGNMVHINDQFLWQQTFLKQPVKMQLDYNTVFCASLHSLTMDDIEFNNERIRIVETNMRPCALHMNGNAKTEGLREPILKHLNLL